jgi:hypothetical protein
VTDFSAPVSLLRKDFNLQNMLFASQPSIVQRFLEGQAQRIAEGPIIHGNAFISEE